MKYLIVIDMQNDFINGSLGTKEAERIIYHVNNKIDKRFAENYKIIFTRDTHEDDYLKTREGKHLPILHCIENTKGWQIPLEIDIPTCKHIDKNTFGFSNWNNSLNENGMEGIPTDILKDAEEIEIIGLCTDICVISNALILRSLYDCEIYVDASCCAGTTPELHKAALDVMKSCQINIIGE